MDIYNVNSYQELDRAIENSEVYISFFGSAMITSSSDENGISIDSVVKKVFHLSSGRNEFSKEEYIAALSIRSKLVKHYRTAGRQMRNSWNIFVIFKRAIDAFLKAYCNPYLKCVICCGSPWRIKLVDLAEEARVFIR